MRVITREVIDAIPTGRGFANFATLIPGVIMSNSSLNISQDVGGGTGYNFAFAAIHGGRAMDQQIMVNGMSVTSLTGTGGTRTNWSDGTAQEYGLLLAGALRRRSPTAACSPTSCPRRAPTGSADRCSPTSPPKSCRPTTSTTTCGRAG